MFQKMHAGIPLNWPEKCARSETWPAPVRQRNGPKIKQQATK